MANVDYTIRRSNNHNVPLQPLNPHQFGAPAAVRLRHSRLRLFNEVDASAGSAAGLAAGSAAGADDDATEAASTSTSVTRQSHGTERLGSASLASRRRREVLAEFRRRAALTLRQRMPVVRDVNKIDRYSRTAFPVLFVVFNVVYWVYYLAAKIYYRSP